MSKAAMPAKGSAKTAAPHTSVTSTARTAAARRLAMHAPQPLPHEPLAEQQQQQQQQLSVIAAAPRTDGRRLPSGRRAGGQAWYSMHLFYSMYLF